ncbi:MAG: acyltransferase [Chitinophagaceae bacterium]|nr:acyltransferase [Chitinophagaceae bacterium]
MGIVLSLKKVSYGKSVRFWSSTYVVRYPESSISIGNNCSFRSDNSSNMIGINRHCMLSTHSKTAVISIGNHCGFSGTVIGAKEKIIIGDDVMCGANTLITDFDWHGILPHERKTSSGDSSPILIGNNVFIGYGSIVLKGVTIGDNSVIGANSVVTRDIPANVIAGGNPCKVIKNL